MRLLLLILVSFTGILSSYAQSSSLLDSAKRLYQHYHFQKVVYMLSSQEDLPKEGSYLLAKAYQQLGQHSEASLNLKKALQQDPLNILYKNELAKQFLRNEEEDSALVLYRSMLEKDSSNAYYWKQIAIIYEEQNKLHLRLKSLRKALELNPSDQESTLQLSSLLLQLDLNTEAKELVQKQLQQYPENKALLVQHLKASYRLKDYQAVISSSEQLFQRSDSALLIQKLAGIARFHEKDFKGAIALLENVAEKENKADILYYYMGLAYREVGDMEKSTQQLNKAIDAGISENLGTYYTQLAVSYEENGDFEKAIKAFQVAYKSSKEKILLYHLARNYDLYYKDKTVALNYYQKYLSENDTANEYYFNYSRHRVQELKSARHFDLGDSLSERF
jgi:tetratricopeptide (TPR) repeat protein